MWELQCVRFVVSGGYSAWESHCVGGCAVWELQFVGVAVCESGIEWESRCGGVEMWGCCNVGERQCRWVGSQ